MNKTHRFLCASKFTGIGNYYVVGVLLYLSFFTASLYAETGANEQSNQVTAADNYFAVINNEKVGLSDFLYSFSKAVKEKFYHGKVSQEQLDAFKKEVAEKLVLEILLSKEALKRGLMLDSAKVQKELNRYDVGLSKDASEEEKRDWMKFRSESLPTIKASIEREQLIALLKENIEKVEQPSVKDIKAYYLANKDKFTAPQRWDVSIILLPVEPSASSDEWDQTVEQADLLLKKISEGESFEELARIHSGDPSAAEGGHMGYMHIGMFGEPAQKVLNVMDVGEVSEPVVLLEGVAIFRLNAIENATLNPFDEVEERAKKLLTRDMGVKAWADYKVNIRGSAKVEFSKLFIVDAKKAETQK